MRYSVNGGIRFDVTGSGFVPEEYTATDPASAPTAMIVKDSDATIFTECKGMSHEIIMTHSLRYSMTH